MITFLIIFAGYFLDAIRDEGDDGLLNDLDHRFVSTVRNAIYRVTHISLPNISSKRARRNALEQFILMLSDQQIVTGLSISLIGFSKHCTMSTYHFFMIVALTWFSSTTHLSTLSLLQHYFRTHRRLKYVRIASMLALYILLMAGMFILYAKRSFQVSMQCRLENISIRPESLSTIVAVALFMYLTVTYISKLTKLSLPSNRSKMQTFLDRKQRYREKFCLSSHHELTSAFDGFRRATAAFYFAYLEFLDSFLWQILWLFFGNFFGIRQLYWVIHVVGRDIKIEQGNEHEFGFGQLLALSLLTLPCLNAVEAFAGTLRACERAREVTVVNLNSNANGKFRSEAARCC